MWHSWLFPHARWLAALLRRYQVADERGAAVAEANYHIAVGGSEGQICVLDSTTLKPLILRNDQPFVGGKRQAFNELKYSPPAPLKEDIVAKHGTSVSAHDLKEMLGPHMLAAGGADLTIYLYKATKNYQLVARCSGHSGTLRHVDWSLPVPLPGTPYDGK